MLRQFYLILYRVGLVGRKQAPEKGNPEEIIPKQVEGQEHERCEIRMV